MKVKYMSKVLGLILELNPFHNGHYYFIQEAKKRVNPDYTIAVLSTNFTMRGDISVFDKFQKTNLALKAGINLVMELPFLSAVNSADFFAYNSVKILTDMGITDLAFGTELDDIGKLEQMKAIIDSPFFQEVIRESLAKGFS
jgi:predicted nucleotidyltransferase